MRIKAFSLCVLMLAMSLSQAVVANVDADASSGIDNWPGNDAWLNIELISWEANQSIEWDNNGGLPDPQFRICIEADSESVDCINTPTWDDQYSLSNVWNYSIDIPDESNILNITIECEDNDALNDDECDMNSDIAEWKLFYEYNWSSNPVVEYSSSGNEDETNNWKDATSTWAFKIDGYGDEDNDGVTDNLDVCPNTSPNAAVLDNESYLGCDWWQIDFDGDGVISSEDSDPFNPNIGLVYGGGRDFNQYGDETVTVTIDGQNYIDVTNNITEIQIVPSQEFQFNDAAVSLIHTWTGEFNDGGQIICESTISSKQYLGNSDTFQLTEIMKLNYTMIMSGNSCDQERPGLLRQHIGTFGDFDGNGIIDFVHSFSDPDQSIWNRCEVYFGITGEQISFQGPIIVGNWDTGITVNRDMCKNGDDYDITGIISADIDNDGFDDIVTDSGILFMSDDGFDSSADYWLGGSIAAVLDYDNDGDLDIISECLNDGCQRKVGYNLWVPDEDNGGTVNSDEFGLVCRETDSDNYFLDTDLQQVEGWSEVSSDSSFWENSGYLLGIYYETNPVASTNAPESGGIVYGNFPSEWTDRPGIDAIITTLGNIDQYEVQLLLSDGTYTRTIADFERIEYPSEVMASYRHYTGGGGTGLEQIMYHKIDFSNFNITSGLTVVGSKVVVYGTPSNVNGDIGQFVIVDDLSNGGKVCRSSSLDFDNGGLPNNLDDDMDNVYNNKDMCPRTPQGEVVDSNGCVLSQKDTDDAGSSTNSTAGVICFLAIIGVIGLIMFISKGSEKKEVRRVRTPTSGDRFSPVPGKMPVKQPNQQEMMQKLENERRYAQQQVMQLQQQLNQSNQMSASQLSSLQSQMQQMQDSVAASEQAKAQIEAELEELKTQTSKTTIDGPMAAEAISLQGDAVTGTKIVNDAEAIAKAASAAAIEAYKQGQKDATSPRCPKCNSVVEAHWKFCVECTEPLN